MAVKLATKYIDGLVWKKSSSQLKIDKITNEKHRFNRETHFVGRQDGSQLIKTDSNFGNARVDFALTDALITEFHEQNSDKVLFVTGFIASTNDGKITTLGRGGSDYTAAIWGAALNVAEIEIWTDVNGMMTADPRIVKKAFSLDELSYIEAMELSYFGAKVIYPPTMVPAFAKKIPLVIKNTFEPEFPGVRFMFSPTMAKTAKSPSTSG